MSRSFAIILRETREKTPDPQRPGKMLTQKRAAAVLKIHLQTYRFYERNLRTPHPIIRDKIFELFPSICDTV